MIQTHTLSAAELDDIEVNLPGWASPLFYPARYKSLRGGRGSSKSHTLAILAILRMDNALSPHYYPFGPIRIACARNTENAINKSVKQVVQDWIKRMGLSHRFSIGPHSIHHKVTGSHMSFPGIERKLDAFLSMEGLDVIWVEQAETLTHLQWDKIGPTIRKVTAERWFSWNPQLRSDWAWQRFVEHRQEDDVSLWINWKSNPWWHETGLETERSEDEMERPHIYAWKWEGWPNDEGIGDIVLPYKTLLECIMAYKEGLAPKMENQAVTYGGLDLAFGGEDSCALVVRHGPTIKLVQRWAGLRGDLTQAAAKAKYYCEPYDIVRLYYDASAEARTDLLRAGFPIVKAVNFGGKVEGPKVMYERSRPNSAVFARRNIQMADALRLRANRTIRLRAGGDVNPAECLFIPPDLPNLTAVLAEWSQPIRQFNITSGKWDLRKKKAGERSPDRFDALALSFARETDGRGLKARRGIN